MEITPINENISAPAKKEVVLKLDSRNRITLKDPKADYYLAEAHIDGVVILRPCAIKVAGTIN